MPVDARNRIPCTRNMMTSSNGNISRVTGHLCGEFTGPPHKGQWHGALIFFFDVRLNIRLSKQSRGWWFETLSRPLWCHRNENYFDWDLVPVISYHTSQIFPHGMSCSVAKLQTYIFFTTNAFSLLKWQWDTHVLPVSMLAKSLLLLFDT